MKTTLLTTALCLLSFGMIAQNEPIALDYSIGSFRIPGRLDQKIAKRFNQLNPNQTYTVTIVGSADFLGSEDNNRTLSNKRVKYAEYHLLKRYTNMRLIIKLDSKGEMHADNRPQTKAGIQDHRMVYIYVEDYNANPSNPTAGSSPSPSDNSVVVTRSAATAEKSLNNASVFVGSEVSKPKKINPISETAMIEIAKQEAARRLEHGALASNNNGSTIAASAPITSSAELNTALGEMGQQNNSTPASGRLNTVGGDNPQRKFDAEGVFTVGEKLLLSDMNFRPGSHYLRPSSIPQLRKLIDVLIANPSLEIEIIGHICCHPAHSPYPDAFDRESGDNKLSFNRASNIKEYLEKNGIDGKRVKATGMGAKERLVFPEETDEDRITNRRVEVRITSL